jgi:hypothetical protein
MTYRKSVFVATSIALAVVLSACSDKQQVPEQEAATASASAASSPIPPAASAAVVSTDQTQQAGEQPETKSDAPAPNGLIRVHFDEVFAIDANGNLSPKVPVDINGVQMTPGVSFGGGVQFGGFALGQALGHDLGVRRLDNGFVQLVQYYD